MDYKEKVITLLNSQELSKEQKEKLEDIFPELKESDDERIRKEIIATIHLYYGEPLENEAKEMIAWLEAQGEQKPYGQREECLDCQFNYAGECKGSCNMKRNEQEEPQVYETEDGEIITYSETDGYKVIVPKFKVGDWITNGEEIGQVIEWNHPDCIGYKTNYGTEKAFNKEGISKWHKWTIQDAKDGDVLLSPSTPEGDKECPFIFKEIDKDGIVRFYAALLQSERLKIADGITNVIGYANAGYHIPATKEQRDLLFQKMKEAGYEWDVDKKELKKIEQKTAWSEEDINKIDTIIGYIASSAGEKLGILLPCINWLKSLKDRIQPQPKQEWSEKDEKIVSRIASVLEEAASEHAFMSTKRLIGDKEVVGIEGWLKSLEDRYTWKPSEEQIEAVKCSALDVSKFSSRSEQLRLENEPYYKALVSLYNDLKKL